jgi:hypothetical protein
LQAEVGKRLVQSRRVGGQARLTYQARKSGVYYLELRLANGNRLPTQYTLALAR